jgi:hypothetical protein
MTGDLFAPSNSAVSGVDSERDESAGGVTTLQWNATSSAVTITMTTGVAATPTVSASVTGWNLSLSINRGTNTAGVTGPDLVSGSFTISTSEGQLVGTITGEAVLTAGVWAIRGMSEITGGTAPFTNGAFSGARGGLRASLATNTTGGAPAASFDDAITWRMDAFRVG